MLNNEIKTNSIKNVLKKPMQVKWILLIKAI